MNEARSRYLSLVLGLCLAGVAPQLSFAADDDGWDENTIRASDIPADAPRFEDYPATVYDGPNAVVDVHSDPTSRMFRTRLKEWQSTPPNFAGHFILAIWGCGADCEQLAIIDARSGKVFHPAGVSVDAYVNVHDELLRGPRSENGPIRHRKDSRLLVLIGAPEERDEDRGISYYVWNENELERIRFVARRSRSKP